MRFTLIQPPIEDFYFTPHRASSLGMAALKSLLLRQNHEVITFNFPAIGRAKKIPLPPVLAYLQPYLIEGEKGPLSYFHSYFRFGPDRDSCIASIQETNPDAVLFSIMAFCYCSPAIDLAAGLKLKLAVPLIAGGPGVSIFPDIFDPSGIFNYIYTGEAEESFIEVLHTLMAGNFQSHSNYHSVSTADEADLEFPLVITGQTKQRTYIAAAATRGCNKNCSFCSVHLHHGRGLRHVPIKKIENELHKMKLLIPQGTKVSINFEDDNLFADSDYAMDVIKCFKRSFPDCSFTAENGLDYLCLHEEMLSRMIDAGFYRFNLSLGSLKTGTLKNNNRTGNISLLTDMVTYLLERDFIPAVFFICGLKEDTPDTIIETLLFLRQIKVKTGISLFYPVPGIPPMESADTIKTMEGFHPRLTAGTAAYPWNGSLSTAEMITAFRLARYNNLRIADPDSGKKILFQVPNLDPYMITSYFSR